MSQSERMELLLRAVSELISQEEFSRKLQQKKSLRIKLGVDPTAPDLHLGHTVVLNKLKQFQELGHTVVFIIGDFTAWIGDPSGRNETRPRISEAEIEKNAQTYLEQVFKILNPNQTEVERNSKWLAPIFEIKKLPEEHSIFSILFNRYTLQQLMQRDDFTKRLKEGNPITFAELMYPLFQAYDSVAVKADIEIGGTDQLFNLLMGRQMQRDFGQEPQVVMTLPLLVGTDGTKKMSKSYGNYVALNDSPKEMFGKLMSIPDEAMFTYYELLTSENLSEIKKMHPKEAKIKLAHQLTSQYHGESAAKSAQVEFEKIFSKGELPESIEEHKSSKNKILLSHLLFECGLAPSKNEAKRFIENGGVKINGKAVAKDSELHLSQPLVLQVGKRKFKRILPIALA